MVGNPRFELRREQSKCPMLPSYINSRYGVSRRIRIYSAFRQMFYRHSQLSNFGGDTCGAVGGIRIPDHRITNSTLYQLSYYGDGTSEGNRTLIWWMKTTCPNH